MTEKDKDISIGQLLGKNSAQQQFDKQNIQPANTNDNFKNTYPLPFSVGGQQVHTSTDFAKNLNPPRSLY